jgi:hypothetical protein
MHPGILELGSRGTLPISGSSRCSPGSSFATAPEVFPPTSTALSSAASSMHDSSLMSGSHVGHRVPRLPTTSIGQLSTRQSAGPCIPLPTSCPFGTTPPLSHAHRQTFKGSPTPATIPTAGSKSSRPYHRLLFTDALTHSRAQESPMATYTSEQTDFASALTIQRQ